MDTESGKRKAEDYPEGEEARIEGVEVEEMIEESVAEQWVCEIEGMLEEETAEWKEDFGETAWDDVNGGEL